MTATKEMSQVICDIGHFSPLSQGCDSDKGLIRKDVVMSRQVSQVSNDVCLRDKGRKLPFDRFRHKETFVGGKE